MKFSAIFRIAIKNLMGKKTRSILTIGGVMVGIAAIVFLVSFAYGVQDLVIERATGLDALKIIDVSTVKSKIIKLDKDAVSQFKNMQGVDSVEVLINVPGKLSYGGSVTDIVTFATSAEYLTMSSVKTAYGSKFDNDAEEVIVNTAVLNLIGVKEDQYDGAIGQSTEINLMIQPELLGIEEGESKEIKRTLKIIGIIADSETPYIFVPSQILINEGVVNYSQAKVKVKDSLELPTIRQQFESIGFTTASASDTVQQIDQIFNIFRIILASFGSIALVVSALGMFNTLTVSLLERTREVGLMKALGAKRRVVFSLFLSESLLISLIGGVFGIFFGWGVGELLNLLFNRLAISTGGEAVDLFKTPLVFVFGIMIFSFAVGFLTGLYPSKRASSLNPLDALRYE